MQKFSKGLGELGVFYKGGREGGAQLKEVKC